MQGFEKMISGMYLGDIVRRVILRMSEETDIFGPVSSKLSVPFILGYVPLSLFPPLHKQSCEFALLHKRSYLASFLFCWPLYDKLYFTNMQLEYLKFVDF